MIWKPGDRAIISPDVKPHPDVPMSFDVYRGAVVTLIKYVGEASWRHVEIDHAWHVQTDYDDLYVMERCLVPIDDHREKGAWEDCVWQPIDWIIDQPF